MDRVADFLSRAGGSIFREISSLGQSADLVYLRGDDLTFVEVKVNATRRAIEQCKAHQLVADFICVAIAGKSVSDENMEKLKSLGYGLISCNQGFDDCIWILMPRRQNEFWQPSRRKVIEQITQGEDMCQSSIG